MPEQTAEADSAKFDMETKRILSESETESKRILGRNETESKRSS